MPVTAPPTLAVFSINRKGTQSVWVRIGTAVVNRDASLNITLDALPLGDLLHIRPVATRDEVTQ